MPDAGNSERRELGGRDRPPSALLDGGAAMTESPKIIKMNIAHYEALLKFNMVADRRATIEGLLAETRSALAVTQAHPNRS